ncbi:MAG: polyprenol monophosphomannose synthase [Leptospirillum sp.]|jgi:dolichol-phosphate mannosyltransferase
MLTLIVPTYNEGENVSILTEAVLQIMEKGAVKEYEILFIDDSTDKTPEILCGLSLEHSVVRYIHRDRERGLGSAITQGFKEARGDVLAVIDGDLQHPPQLLPLMLSLTTKGYDLVIPSRFIAGGGDGGLSLPRKIVSLVARYMAKILFRRVRSISDPTGGYFMMRRGVIDEIDFDGSSWKILIELLVKGNYTRVAEVPYFFCARELGASKLSIAAQLDYLRHLKTLFFSEENIAILSGRGRVSLKDAEIDHILP